jgi:hypothetical protein
MNHGITLRSKGTPGLLVSIGVWVTPTVVPSATVGVPGAP